MPLTCLLDQSPEDCVAQYQSAITLLSTYARGPLALETVFWGVFSCLIICSALLWIWDSPHNKRKIAMIAMCILMYAIATAHWVLTISGFVEIAAAFRESPPTTGPAFDGSSVSPWARLLDYSVWHGGRDPQAIPAVLLTFSILLSDLIVLYRACLVWDGNRSVRVISFVLYLTLTVTSVICVCAAFTSSGGFAPHVGDAGCPDLDLSCIGGIPATWISLCLNVWATSMIGYKAWIHRCVVGKYLTTGTTRTRSEKILALLVDSGLLYCALWTFVTAAESSFEGGTSISMYLQNGALIHMIGIYPTILVTAVSIERLKGPGTIQTVHVLTQGEPIQAQDVHIDMRASTGNPSVGVYDDPIDSVIRIEAAPVGSEEFKGQNSEVGIFVCPTVNR